MKSYYLREKIFRQEIADKEAGCLLPIAVFGGHVMFSAEK